MKEPKNKKCKPNITIRNNDTLTEETFTLETGLHLHNSTTSGGIFWDSIMLRTALWFLGSEKSPTLSTCDYLTSKVSACLNRRVATRYDYSVCIGYLEHFRVTKQATDVVPTVIINTEHIRMDGMKYLHMPDSRSYMLDHVADDYEQFHMRFLQADRQLSHDGDYKFETHESMRWTGVRAIQISKTKTSSTYANDILLYDGYDWFPLGQGTPQQKAWVPFFIMLEAQAIDNEVLIIEIPEIGCELTVYHTTRMLEFIAKSLNISIHVLSETYTNIKEESFRRTPTVWEKPVKPNMFEECIVTAKERT